MVGKASGSVFGVNQAVIDFDVEDPASALNQLGGFTGGVLNGVRQTGGLWPVVSLYAVRDTNSHRDESSWLR